jgi:hypothetical protein
MVMEKEQKKSTKSNKISILEKLELANKMVYELNV